MTQFGTIEPDNRVFAVIGLGNISRRHRSNLSTRFDSARIVAVSASGRTPISMPEHADYVFLDIADVLGASPSLVVVASPASLHTEHALPFLRAGIPTLIEKPLANTTSQCRILQNVAAETQCLHSVGYCLRFHPVIRAAKEALEANLIGEVFHIFCSVGQFLPDWRPGTDYRTSVSASSELGGGAVFELSHELDYLDWLFGPLQCRHAILGKSRRLDINVESAADLTLFTGTSTVVHVHMDFLQKPAQRRCSITGESGRLELDLLKQKLELIKHDGNTFLVDLPTWDPNEMYLAMLDELVGATSNQNGRIASTINDAARTVDLITRIKELAIIETIP